jgi:hypothetical protein
MRWVRDAVRWRTFLLDHNGFCLAKVWYDEDADGWRIKEYNARSPRVLFATAGEAKKAVMEQFAAHLAALRAADS